MSPEGWEEIGYLARQYQKMFPKLFDKTYSKNVYEFRHTNQMKTNSSFKAFANGLFGPAVVDRDIKLAPIEDPDMLLLVLYIILTLKRCGKYVLIFF